MIAELQPYPAYKESSLSWFRTVPAHWKNVPGFAVFRENKTKNTGLREDTILSLSYGKIVVKPKDKLHGLVPESFESYQIVEPGDVIIRSTDLQNDWTSLRVGLVRNHGIITSAYLGFKVTDALVAGYGYQLLNAFDLMKVFYGMGSGLRQNLSFSDFKRMPLFLPPPDEQAAIVRFLDYATRRIERAIRAKRKLITLLNEQKQTIIHRAVTRSLDSNAPLRNSGIDWIGEIPAHWEVRRICSFARVGNGSTPSRTNPNYWSYGKYPWLNSSQVNRGFIDSADQFITLTALQECHLPRVPAGSLLVAITGQGKTRGTAALLGIEATINQHIAYIKPREEIIKPAFFQLVLMAAYKPLRTLSEDSGSTKGALTCDDLKRFKIAIPDLSEQDKIMEIFKAETGIINTAIDRTEREIKLLQEYRTRLIADVVTGKVDVREAAQHLPAEVDNASTTADEDLIDDEDIDELVTAEADDE